MNELQIFKNEEFGEVRTVIVDDEPWFVAADVCRALELGNPSQAISRLDDDEVTLTTNEGHSGKLGGPQKMNIVSEAGLYSLILKSRKPEAKRFKRWITHEVIPTIRKTGGYVNDESTFIATYLPFADEGTKALFAQTLGALRSANQKIEADKPKVLFADAVSTSKSSILIGDLAKILKQNGMDIGQRRLFEYLRNNGYLIKGGSSKNLPTQRSMEMGLFEIKESAISNPDGSVRITRTTKVSGRGQQFLINKFLGKKAESPDGTQALCVEKS
nr:MAG TPA: repressor domain protein [Caudoviricetes sp.]